MKKKMIAIFKIIILISLIINSLTADSCSSIKSPGECTGSCEWKAATQNTCTGKETANDVTCSGGNADSTSCFNIKSSVEELCTFTPGTNTCTAIDPANNAQCTPANTDEESCNAVKSTPESLCTYTAENECAAKKEANTEKCAAANEDSTACEGIKSTAESLCTFTKGINVCAAKKAADTEKCAAANGDSTACKGVKSTAESLCTFTKGTEAHCKDAPVTFKELTIKLTSVKVKNVEVTIIPDNEDIDKKVTSDTIIENLQLSSGSSFTEDLTCKISTGSKLGTVICTMEKAATKDTKYKLIAKGESKVSLKGDDTFNGVKINDNEVTATEDNNNTNTDQGNSSYLKFSVFIALLVILF